MRLPGSGWLDLGLIASLGVSLLVSALLHTLTMPLLFVLSIVLFAYAADFRNNRRWLSRPSLVVALQADFATAAGRVTLRWKAPPDPSFAGVRVVRIGEFAAEGSLVYEGFRTNCTDERLPPGSRWQYRVFSRALEGELLERYQAIEAGPPPLPPDLYDVRCRSGERNIELTWRLPLDPNVRGLLLVRRSDRPPVDHHDGLIIQHDNVQRFLDERDVRPATIYFYRICCLDLFDQASLGVTVEATTRAPGVGQPLQAVLVHGAIRLTWTTPRTRTRGRC